MSEREYSMILNHEELWAIIKQHCSTTMGMLPKEIFLNVQDDGKVNCVVTMTFPSDDPMSAPEWSYPRIPGDERFDEDVPYEANNVEIKNENS